MSLAGRCVGALVTLYQGASVGMAGEKLPEHQLCPSSPGETIHSLPPLPTCTWGHWRGGLKAARIQEEGERCTWLCWAAVISEGLQVFHVGTKVLQLAAVR